VRLESGALRLCRAAEGPVPAAVKLFHLAQRYAIPVELEDLAALEQNRALELEVNSLGPEESWSFLSVLNEQRNVARTIRPLSPYGLLDRFIPIFSELTRFVPPDPAHRYTVGEHSLKIIEHLEDLRQGLDGAGQRFSELLAQCPHFDVLCLAALLHDA